MTKTPGKKRKIDPTEQLGVKAVELAITRFGWVARGQYVGDFGVDVHAETARPDGTASGRLLAIQVKSGPSYFQRGNRTELHFPVDADHHAYWEGHSLPTLIAFYNPETDQILWQWTSEAKRTGKLWRISVPRTQELTEAVKDQLAKVAEDGNRLQPNAATDLAERVEKEVTSTDSKTASPTLSVAVTAIEPTIRPKLQADVGDDPNQALLAQMAKLLDEKLKPLHAQTVEASAGSSSDTRRVGESEALHVQIDQLRDIKNEGDPAIAHRKLAELLPKIDQSTTPFAYFRVVTNLAACALDLGQADEAEKGFEKAYELEPDDPLAITNLGLARLLDRKYQEAFDLAERAIAKGGYPTHTLTVLIGASARLDPEAEPEKLIPEADLRSVSADFAVAEFYRVTGNPKWIDSAIEGAAKHADDPSFKRLRAYAVLEAATTDQRFVQGGQSRVSVADVAAAAETLREDIEKKLAGGFADKEELANEATNAAIAYRVIADFKPAISLLDRVLAYTGHQPNAVRLLGLGGYGLLCGMEREASREWPDPYRPGTGRVLLRTSTGYRRGEQKARANICRAGYVPRRQERGYEFPHSCRSSDHSRALDKPRFHSAACARDQYHPDRPADGAPRRLPHHSGNFSARFPQAPAGPRVHHRVDSGTFP